MHNKNRQDRICQCPVISFERKNIKTKKLHTGDPVIFTSSSVVSSPWDGIEYKIGIPITSRVFTRRT